MLARLPNLAPRHLRARFTTWLRGTSSGLAALALAVGVGAGLGAVVFRGLITFFTFVMTGHPDYSLAGGSVNQFVPWLGPFFVVLAPVVGGLVYGPVVNRFASEARGHGVPEVMLAVAERGGRIRPQVSVVKAVASALCIGSGGSVGREGPIVQIGSALGSTLGQLLRVPESRMRILVACGAAGGISATFNAPIAGVFFALELILVDFAAQSFGVVVLASVAAAVIGRASFGNNPFLVLPAFELRTPWELALYALLGVVAAGVGVGFTKVLYTAEDTADRLWRWSESFRPAAGGVLLGLLLLVMPEMYGVGYPVVEKAIGNGYSPLFLILLLVAKILAVSITLAIGGSGGVFAPSLFMGAMLGTAFGLGAGHILPNAASPGAYGIVGMGAVFAAAARAPITAVIIVFEMTGDYSVILPLMFAVAIATSLSHFLTSESIYTLKLRRRGIAIRRSQGLNLMEVIRVSEAMSPVPEAVLEDASLSDLAERFGHASEDALPVKSNGGAFLGVIRRREVEDTARSNALDARAADLVESVAPVYAEQTCAEALSRLVEDQGGALPVVQRNSGRLVGWLGHRDVLRAVSRNLNRDVSRASGSSDPTSVLPGYRLVDLELTTADAPAGRRVADVDWPPGSLLVAVRRADDAFPPRGSTVLAQGDRLVVLTPVAAAADLADRIKRTPTADGEGHPAER